jgi:hypothetical protein
MGGDFEKVVQFAQRLEQFCDIRILCCFNQTLLETIILLKLYTLLIIILGLNVYVMTSIGDLIL